LTASVRGARVETAARRPIAARKAVKLPGRGVPAFSQSDRVLSQLRRRPVVLVVHQEEALRTLVRRSIEAEGYVALEARTATDTARVGAKAAEIDLVVTDLSQPGLAGPGGLREQLGGRTKFLYMLMNSTDSDVPEEDVTFFLQNPFRGRALEDKLRRILRR
jgi:DNA-binding response OmpR family regulator